MIMLIISISFLIISLFITLLVKYYKVKNSQDGNAEDKYYYDDLDSEAIPIAFFAIAFIISFTSVTGWVANSCQLKGLLEKKNRIEMSYKYDMGLYSLKDVLDYNDEVKSCDNLWFNFSHLSQDYYLDFDYYAGLERSK